MSLNHQRCNSIEESLQDWISKNIPDPPTSGLLDATCSCCRQNECEHFETFSSTIRKLDNDARLAAVIGQTLLQKHEQYVNESNDIKQRYDQEVELLNEKIRELEQSLLESDTLNKEYLEEKNKALWEWQKTQKTLDETTSDLEICNNRCIQLGTELKAKINEIEKLRVFKFMARQADIREETIKTKLEDVKQELAISRKAELILESKHKKLKTKYESVCNAYEKLKSDQQELGITQEFQLDLVWLRKSNEKLRKDVLKLTSALLSSNTAADMQINNNQLIELIKELATANNKLKSDLLDYMESKNDIYEEETTNKLKRVESKRSIIKEEEKLPSTSVVHHHYHYYMKNKDKSNGNKNLLRNLASKDQSKTDTSSPFRQLFNQVTDLIQRLQQTDIRALNRRLKKAFDIFELSGMSNSIIENIISDIDTLKNKFCWIEDVKNEAWVQDVSMLEFFPIVELLQAILKEISQLRTTMNELQVEYVKKVEQSDIQFEQELLRKQQEQKNINNSPLSWFANMFQRSNTNKENNAAATTPIFNTKFLNSSETSIHSAIHPLSTKPKMIPSDKIAIRRQKSDIDRHGPPSSFPSKSFMTDIKKRRSASTTLCSSPISENGCSKPLPLRPSQSAGTVRKSNGAPGIEYVVRKKRSTLALSSSFSSDFDLFSSPQPTTVEMAGTFTTSWLGNK